MNHSYLVRFETLVFEQNPNTDKYIFPAFPKLEDSLNLVKWIVKDSAKIDKWEQQKINCRFI